MLKQVSFFTLFGWIGFLSTLLLTFAQISSTPAAVRQRPQPSIAQPTEPASVFLLAGQSNMAGEGSMFELPFNLAVPSPSVQIWRDRTQSFIDLRPGFAENSGDSTEFGPELSFGHAINGHTAGTIYLIKYALGGTNLAVDWAPSSADNQHHIFVTQVKAALAQLIQQNIPYTVEGMLWMQGENDAFESEQYALDYEANLTALIADMRDRYGSSMKFSIGQLHYLLPDGFTYQDTVRAAQESVALADPLTSLVKTGGFTVQSDNVHFDTAGLISLGRAFAMAMGNAA